MLSTHSSNASLRRLAKVIMSLCLLALLGTVAQVAAQQADKRIEAISRLYLQIHDQITASENEKPYSAIFRDELVLNKNDNTWPVVGIYQSVIQSFYTFSEEEPYPNRLLQVTVSTKRSDRREYAEYLFNPAGQLVFCFEKNTGDPTVEVRYYFANGRAIRITKDSKPVQISSAQLKEAQGAMNEGLRLKRLFALGQSD